MTDLTRERFRVFSIGIAAALLAALLRALVFRFVGTAIPFLTFFPAIIAAALWGGTRSAVTASVLTLVLAPIWMAEKSEPFDRVDWLNLFFFCVSSALIVWATRRAYRARMQSARLGSQLADTEARFRHLADNIPQLTWMARPDGHIFWYNQRWFDFTGASEAEMDGWGWRAVHDPAELPRVLKNWKHALTTGTAWEDTFPLRRRDGVYRWFLSRAMPMKDEKGALRLWFGSNTDITEQRVHAEERRQLLESERAARSNAERASLLKDEFLATLSHELRTPLNAILGWAQLLRDGVENESALKEGLRTIERNARVQTHIVEDLLEMSRIVSGKTRLEVQPANLASVIESAVTALQPTAASRQVRIIKVLDPVPVISGDPARLQQIVWNLLANAIKFTPKGGRATIVLQRIDSHVEICVSDDGEGIAPEFLPHVFDRFRQQDASRTRRHGGLGIGLSIVKSLVELHGGTVRAESAGLDRGSAFIVTLPLTPLRQQDRVLTYPADPSDGAGDFGLELDRVHILIVDDDRDSLQWVRRLLEDRKATVSIATTADEGLRLNAELVPDIIVSDIGMPDKDGLEMIRELRASPGKSAQTPAIALTAFARSEDRTRAMLAGYQVHLAKPVDARELIAAVANLVGRTGAAMV